jgi:hypothetical protein
VKLAHDAPSGDGYAARLRTLAVVAGLAIAAGCESGGDGAAPAALADAPQDTAPADTTPADPAAGAPFQALYDQGVDRYQGVFAPMLSETLPGGVITWAFDGSDNGPLCFTGGRFSMSTRDGSSSELMIFLQGGGACSEDGCGAVEVAPPGIPAFGILDPDRATNPAASYNVGYLPYCDGTFFSGDRDVDSDGDGSPDRFFRGVQNLAASLDVIVGRYPAPSRILLAGNSAGGFGTHYALPLVRKLYPDVPIDLVNDSGVGILAPGVLDDLTEYWNAGAWYPASCETCLGEDGHLTDYHSYQLAEDENVRMAFLSYTQDDVVLATLPTSAGEWEAELLEAMAELREEYPTRFRSLIAGGDGHTFIIRDLDRPVGGVTVAQWIADMLSGSDEWVSVSD